MDPLKCLLPFTARRAYSVIRAESGGANGGAMLRAVACRITEQSSAVVIDEAYRGCAVGEQHVVALEFNVIGADVLARNWLHYGDVIGLGADTPVRDLYVSPKYAMFIDDVLVTACPERSSLETNRVNISIVSVKGGRAGAVERNGFAGGRAELEFRIGADGEPAGSGNRASDI